MSETPRAAPSPQRRVTAILDRAARAVGLAHWPRRAPVVPVLHLTGVIGTGSALRPALGIARLDALIERAFDTRRAKAVALLINSPGGSPAQSHLIMRRIRALAAEKKLPVYAFVEDVAASGGYMIACAADEIIADPSSIIGSIGVVSASFGFDRLLERVGVERRVHTAGASKAMLDPFQPERPEDVERLRAIQNDLHAMFIDLVKESRGARLKGSEEDLFSGAFWLAGKAVSLGLADSLGDINAVLRARYGDKVRLKEITAPRGFLARRLAAHRPGLAADFLAAIEERASWARFGL